MRDKFEALAKKFPRLKEQAESADGITIYFCGGGFRGYGSMLMHTDPIQPYPVPAIGGYTVPGHRFIKWREMHHTNNYEEGKIFGMSKRRREQFQAIVTVVQSLVEAIPKIKEVTFCSGGNREGVLYMKLPPKTRESNPLSLLPGGVANPDSKSVISVVDCMSSALPKGYPDIFLDPILNYVARNIWQDMGHADDTNSTKALNIPISGALAGLPGMTHETRAIIALTMCARWGADLGPGDKKLRDNLRALVRHELSWWCDYVGTIARLLAAIIPVFPGNDDLLKRLPVLKASTSNGLGKKGHKVGIRLKIVPAEGTRKGVSAGTLEGLFDKVGKGLHIGWKVEAEVED
jgi:retrograde regulation protein 2